MAWTNSRPPGGRPRKAAPSLLRRLLQPPRSGLSDGDYFELRLLTVGSLSLFMLGLFTTFGFPLLFGFSLMDFLVTGGATAFMGAAYAFAIQGHRRTGSWLLIGAVTAGVWTVLLRNSGSPAHEMYILANLIPVLLAFTLRRFLMGVGVTLAALFYVLYHVATVDHALSGLSVAVLFVAGAFVAGMGPVLRERDRKHAQHAERQRQVVQADYRSLFHNMTEGFAHCRMIFEDGVPTDWEYLRVNPAFAALTGLHDAAGKRVSQVIPGLREADPALFERYARVAKGVGPEQFEVEVAALNRWFAISAYAAGPDEFVAVFDNITERKRAEENLVQAHAALAASEGRLRTLLDNLDEGFVSTDLVSKQTLNSAGVSRIFGHPRAAYDADPMLWSRQLHPDDAAGVMANYAKLLAGIPTRDETRIIRPDGDVRWVRASMYPIKDAGGTVVRIDGALSDITMERQAAEQRAALDAKDREVERFAELSRMRMEFLNTAAHDLKTPLTPLKLEMATLRLRGKLDAQQAESLALMDRNLTRFQVLVDDMLDAARLQSGRLMLRRESVALGPLVQEAVTSFKESASQANLALEVDALPDVHIDADPSKAMQVLMNLVSNAVKYTPAGGTLRIHVASDAKEVIVSFQDSGLGMTTEQLGKLFQPFVRVHEDEKGIAKGTGLGLYICKGIVEQHGGRIWAESDGPGKGSTFHVAWPLEKASQPVDLVAA